MATGWISPRSSTRPSAPERTASSRPAGAARSGWFRGFSVFPVCFSPGSTCSAMKSHGVAWPLKEGSPIGHTGTQAPSRSLALALAAPASARCKDGDVNRKAREPKGAAQRHDLRARLARLRELRESEGPRERRLYLADMTAAEIAAVEERMRPGCSSTAGFLETNQSLAALIEQDTATLTRLGVTHERLACWLESFLSRGLQLESATTGHLLIEGRQYAGYHLCPFSPEGRPCGRCDSEFTVKNLSTGEAFFVSGLHPHLIRDHHFFEGGPYRLDPEQAVRVLELLPNLEDCRRTVSIKSCWGFGSTCSWKGFLWQCPDIQRLMQRGKRLGPHQGMEAYLDGDIGFLCAEKPISVRKPIVLDGTELPVESFSGGAEILRYRAKVVRVETSRLLS